jgi:hypothetical protein
MFKSVIRRPFNACLPLFIAVRQMLFRRKFEADFAKDVIGERKNSHRRSHIPVSIFIPVAVKDLGRLSRTIKSLREFLQHPILEIVICGANEISLTEACAELDVKFIDERIVQPISKSEITYTCNGIDRSGWIYQQLLKINSIKCCISPHILVWDSDTELVQPVNFEYGGKLVIEYSEEHHVPYDACSMKLLGTEPIIKVGFTCHKILFDRRFLIEMIDLIEARFEMAWYEAIMMSLDSSEASSFSEYNLYSSYVTNNHLSSVQLRHWHNFADRESASRVRRILIQKLFVSVSYHSWAQ